MSWFVVLADETGRALTDPVPVLAEVLIHEPGICIVGRDITIKETGTVAWSVSLFDRKIMTLNFVSPQKVKAGQRVTLSDFDIKLTGEQFSDHPDRRGELLRELNLNIGQRKERLALPWSP